MVEDEKEGEDLVGTQPPPCKKRLSPSSPSTEVVMEELQLPVSAKKDAACKAFQESVRLEVDVKTLYPLLPFSTSEGSRGAMIRVEAKQLPVMVDTGVAEKKTFCVLCDGSGSMRGEGYQEMCTALEASVQVLRETGRTNFNVAIVRFDSDASVIYGPDKIPNDDELKEIVKKLSPAGGTDIAKALEVFQEKVSAPLLQKGESVVCVLITDGDDSTLASYVRNGARNTEMTRKLGNVSGETIHFLGVSQVANMTLLRNLGNMCYSTCNRVDPDSIAGVLGSAIALEKTENIVKVTVDVCVPGEESPTTLVTQERINLRYSTDDEPAPTDISIQLPQLKEGEKREMEVKVKLEVYDFGYVESPTSKTLLLTQEKTFTLKGAASEEDFSLAMKDPCLEYILFEAKRTKGSVDGKVAGFLSSFNIDGAIATVNKGIEDVRKFMALTSDQTTVDALEITVQELEAQNVELENSRTERARLDNIRDRAYSEAMTDRNNVSVYGRGQSNTQQAARTLSAATARTLSMARSDSQDLRNFSYDSAAAPSMSRSSTGVSTFGNMRLNSAAVIEEPENESQDVDYSGRC
jgi:hypothetical protein